MNENFSEPFYIHIFLTVYLSKQDNDNMYKTGRTDITAPKIFFFEKRRHLEIHKIYETKKRRKSTKWLLYPVKDSKINVH